MNRARHEAQIQRLDDGHEFEDALTTLAFRHNLAWFTDEQIAALRNEMIAAAAKRRRRDAISRANFAGTIRQPGA